MDVNAGMTSRQKTSTAAVQFDAHLDFREEANANGQREGYSSPTRRASESPWVERIVHVGTRGRGSARRVPVDLGG